MLLLPVPNTWPPKQLLSLPQLLQSLPQLLLSLPQLLLLSHTALQHSLVSLTTPTVLSSQLSPLMLSLPAPNTWLPMLKKKT